MLKKVTKIEVTRSNLPKCLNFIHHKSIGDLKQCEEICEEIYGRGIIREIYDSNKVSGISVTLVKSYDDALSKFIIDIDSILKILSTNKLKKYPFVLIEASPFDNYTEEITKYLSSKDFLRL